MPQKKIRLKFFQIYGHWERMLRSYNIIVEHLNTLHKQFGEYFQTSGEEWNWIRDPAV
jgi:hypothetical protein